MNHQELKKSLIEATSKLKNIMNEYGKNGFSVDINVRYCEHNTMPDFNVVFHEIELEIKEGLHL